MYKQNKRMLNVTKFYEKHSIQVIYKRMLKVKNSMKNTLWKLYHIQQCRGVLGSLSNI